MGGGGGHFFAWPSWQELRILSILKKFRQNNYGAKDFYSAPRWDYRHCLKCLSPWQSWAPTIEKVSNSQHQQSTNTFQQTTASDTQQLTASSQQLTPDKLTTNTTDRYTPPTKTNNRPPTVYNRQEENTTRTGWKQQPLLVQPEGLERDGPCWLLKMRQTGTQGVHIEGVLPLLVLLFFWSLTKPVWSFFASEKKMSGLSGAGPEHYHCSWSFLLTHISWNVSVCFWFCFWI